MNNEYATSEAAEMNSSEERLGHNTKNMNNEYATSEVAKQHYN